MVGCEGGFALLAVSPCLDVLVAHHLNCDIAFIDSTTLSCHSLACILLPPALALYGLFSFRVSRGI